MQISGILSVIGCIDETSIPIRTLAHKIKSTYINRHDTPSITLQGVCDYKKRFVDVFTGAPGKIHDSRVFALSDLSKTLPIKCGKKIHLIGDGAYSLREWLLIPYKDSGRLTETQRYFNKRFCVTKVLIDNSFGLLKSRFRQLLQLDIHSVDKITKFIVSSCVLHNLCIDMNNHIIPEDVDEDDLSVVEEPDNIMDSEMIFKRNGERKREAIQNSLQFM